MDKPVHPKEGLARLRSRAEIRARKQPRDERDVSCLAPDEIRQLVHELDVQHIELEMQNDELRQSQAALEKARDRYSHLFNEAPVAYLRLDAKGHILQVNRTGVELLAAEGNALSKMRLQDFVDSQDQDHFFACLRHAMKCRGRATCELEMARPDGSCFTAHVEALAQTNDSGKAGECLMVLIDMTERENMEAALRESEARFRDMADSAPAMLWVADSDGLCDYISQGWYDFTGLAVGAGMGHGWLEALHAEDRGTVDGGFREATRRREAFEHEYRLRRADGSYRWVINTGRPRISQDGEFIGYIGSVTDIDERKRAEEHAREVALHDPLTGLPNRALIFEYSRHQLAEAQRSQSEGAILFVDLDRFKQINDQFGHETGDQVLLEIAKRLTECTRQADLVGRLGGDEFVILLPHLNADRERAATVARHIISSLSSPISFASKHLTITPSIGISCYPDHGRDIDTLIHAADLAMYQAKSSGRATFHFYSHDMAQRAAQTLDLETQIRHALQHDAFLLHYQPVIDLQNGRLVGVEALIRLAGHSGKMTEPQQFIPVAESCGLIGALGEWVAAAVCRQQQQWQEQGIRSVMVSINVSPLQFKQPDFVERFTRILSGGGNNPSCFQLEVTESAFIERVDEVIASLRRLRELGVRIALDDFGIGYSSLNLLTRLPLDMLKIDQSFVQRMESDPLSMAVTKAIIALGQTLSLKVVAEGIESEAAISRLRDFGCDHAQGYLISRPMTSDQFVGWYRHTAKR